MGGIGFNLRIAPKDGAERRPVAELSTALFEILNSTIYDFTHAQKAYKAVRLSSTSDS